MIFNTPWATPPKPALTPDQAFLEAIAAGHTDKGAAGKAGWTVEEAQAYAEAHPREYQIADNKRQAHYEERLIETGRGYDIARVALRQETKSWVAKADPVPASRIEDYLD
jgi:hypothetical protein